MKTTLVLMVTAWLVAGLQAAELPKDESKPFNITTTLGETYKNCRIVKATPEGLTVVHDRGVAKLSFEILGDEWREKFRYDPSKAREFATAEEKRTKEAAAKRAELNKRRELSEEDMLADLAAQERRRIELESKLMKEQADAVKAANTPPTQLAPMPGDPQTRTGTQTSQPVVQTEMVIPTVTPITDVYTPTKIRSQTYILQDGLYYGGGYPPYGYYQPIYGYPGYVYPGQPCPHQHATPYLRPGVGGRIATEGMTIQINR